MKVSRIFNNLATLSSVIHNIAVRLNELEIYDEIIVDELDISVSLIGDTRRLFKDGVEKLD